MFDDMIANCIVAVGVFILFSASIYYVYKCDKLKKELKTLRTLIFRKCKSTEDWPNDEVTKKILGVLENKQ